MATALWRYATKEEAGIESLPSALVDDSFLCPTLQKHRTVEEQLAGLTIGDSRCCVAFYCSSSPLLSLMAHQLLS